MILGIMETETDLVLNGSKYEGGGGLLRDALAYSTILNKSIRIHSIRAQRPGKGGLRAEHTVAISHIASLSNASIEGIEHASPWIKQWPHAKQNDNGKLIDNLEIDLEGSAAIALMSLLPHILFSHLSLSRDHGKTISPDGISLELRGGTLCIKAPSYHYMTQVMIPTFNLIGLSDNISLGEDNEQGWHTDFVKTRTGLVKAWVKPMTAPLPGFVLLHRGRVVNIRATAHAPAADIELFRSILTVDLQHFLGNTTNPQLSTGVTMLASNVPSQYHLLLTAQTEAPAAYLGYELVYPQLEGFPLGDDLDMHTKVEFLTRACIRGFLAELRHGNAVDEHMENILTVYQALAVGWSSVTSPMNEQIVREQGNIDLGGK